MIGLSVLLLVRVSATAQDPLGDVKAIMTDNTIAFDGGEYGGDTSYGFQIQPVYAIENDTSFNMIARAVIPIIGVDPGVVLPPLGPEERPDEDDQWGLSDSIVQYFLSPKGDGAVKWGIGPQVSLKTPPSGNSSWAFPISLIEQPEGVTCLQQMRLARKRDLEPQRHNSDQQISASCLM